VSDLDALVRLLAEAYRPVGHRLGIVMLSTAPAEEVEAAAEQLATHGLTAQRRLARLLPRPDETGHRAEDVIDFLRRYGHEYSVAWLPTRELEDVEAVTAAAHEAGCAIGWATR
jgi:kynureninase